MDLDDTYKAIEVFIVANWPGALSAVDYVFGEANFTVAKEPASTDSWVRIIIYPGIADKLEIRRLGASIRNGVIMINVFTPKISGTRLGASYAAEIEGMLRHQRLETSGVLNCYEPSTTYVPNQLDTWLNHLVTIPFTVLI